MRHSLSTVRAFGLGALGLPLAFVALPLYVHLPQLYSHYGIALATLGAILLATRLLDALIDPLLGRLITRWQFQTQLKPIVALFALMLCASFVLLLNPALWWPQFATRWQWLILVAALLLAYWSYSFLSILQQSDSAYLANNNNDRARLVAWREGLTLGGVVLAAVLPTQLGGAQSAVFLLLMVPIGCVLLFYSRASVTPSQSVPPSSHNAASKAQSISMGWWHLLKMPWRDPFFQSLVPVFVTNGIASAVPATLLLFFANDLLGASASEQSLFLLLYFLAGAMSLPLWLKMSQRYSLGVCWVVGMLLAVVIFASVVTLVQGDIVAFAVICVLSGLCLGIDLIAPGALLLSVIQRDAETQKAAAMYVGWWHLLTKLNLALAAGIALPLLAWWGYQPNQADSAGLAALSWGYSALPCGFKLIAAALLWRWQQQYGSTLPVSSGLTAAPSHAT